MTSGKLNILIPLNGEGTRFQNADYHNTKPFVRIQGKEVLFWLLDNLDMDNIACIIVPYAAHMDNYNIQHVLRHRYKKTTFSFVPLHFSTLEH